MNLIAGSVSVLNDAVLYLDQISTADYNHPIGLMSNATIGQHSRHFIEFYQCLLAQADQGSINYCLRQRNKDIETNPQEAIAAIRAILAKLETLNLTKSITLKTSKEGNLAIASNIGRELFYNIEHTIHHLALIKIGLRIVVPDLSLPKHFGVAPSTIRHQKLVPHS